MPHQTKFTSKLQGAHVLVIGGSSGIGFAAAEAAIESGANVIISSSSQKKLDSAVGLIQKDYPSASTRISGRCMDLGNETTLEDEVETFFSKLETNLDHIIYTAGDRLAIKNLNDFSLAEIRQAGMLRFFAPLMVVKYGARCLNAGSKSSITLTGGGADEKAHENWSVISSYLAGLHGMVRGLALDLKPIRVNLVSPGAILTPLWDMLPADQRASFLKTIGDQTTTGKVGDPQDLAHAYLYAMNDYNLTGTVIRSNGGAFLV